MKSSRILVGAALAASCLMFDGAQAQALADMGDGAAADADMTSAPSSDLIFDGGFEAQTNGGTTCATASVLEGDATYSSDTTLAPNWMSTFGPLLSPSNDVVFEFVAGSDVEGAITPTVANYDFAMYLIPSCDGDGSQPSPIGATATLGRGIDLATAGVMSGNTYYLAITGSASAGAGANGFLTFTTPFSLAIPVAPRHARTPQ